MPLPVVNLSWPHERIRVHSMEKRPRPEPRESKIGVNAWVALVPELNDARRERGDAEGDDHALSVSRVIIAPRKLGIRPHRNLGELWRECSIFGQGN